MRNEKYLQKVLNKEVVDYLYHIGLTSESEEIKKMKNIKAVVMAGSRKRIQRMAAEYQGNKESFVLEKKERFYGEYKGDVLFISHGMGIPSMSICLQEVLKLIYYVKHGDMEAVNKIFICRVGTSGGLQLPEGSIVLTKESFMADLKPYKIKRLGNDNLTYSGSYPQNVIDAIIESNKNENIKINIGNTISGDDFYLEQLRQDGATIILDEGERDKVFKAFVDKGIKNIEMEAAAIPAFCGDFGHYNYATVCATLVDRYHDDQVNSTAEQLKEYSLRAERVIFNYLKTL